MDRSIVDKIRWRLIYGRIIEIDHNESIQDSSISMAPRGAKFLALTYQGTEIYRIELDEGWLPVFYRVHQMEMNVGQSAKATIFGRYNNDLAKAELWEWEPELNQLSNCRPQFFDEVAIKVCVSNHLKGS